MKSTIALHFLLIIATSAHAQMTSVYEKSKEDLKTYLIEREITGAGDLTADQLKGISQQSCKVIKNIGPKIEWLHSYVTDNKVYCIYKAENEDILRQHAKEGGFPINRISLLATKIGPETAENNR